MGRKPDEVIRCDEAYTIREFRARCGVGDYVWRRLRHKLPLRAVGKSLYVVGSDWIEFLKSIPPVGDGDLRHSDDISNGQKEKEPSAQHSQRLRDLEQAAPAQAASCSTPRQKRSTGSSSS